jgi:hypothetical protein
VFVLRGFHFFFLRHRLGTGTHLAHGRVVFRLCTLQRAAAMPPLTDVRMKSTDSVVPVVITCDAKKEVYVVRAACAWVPRCRVSQTRRGRVLVAC